MGKIFLSKDVIENAIRKNELTISSEKITDVSNLPKVSRYIFSYCHKLKDLSSLPECKSIYFTQMEVTLEMLESLKGFPNIYIVTYQKIVGEFEKYNLVEPGIFHKIKKQNVSLFKSLKEWEKQQLNTHH